MSDRWSRMAPLTGVLFAVLTLVAVFSNDSESPKPSTSASKVVAYFSAHHSKVETSAILFAFAFLALVLFSGALRSYLRRNAASEGLSAMVLAGGVLMAVGALSVSGIEYGLAHNLHHFSPEAAKTLDFISSELFLPIVAGGFVFGVCGGLAILRGAALPAWLGWVAIVIGIATLVPPASFVALLAFLIWAVVVSVLMYMRSGQRESFTSRPEAQLA